MLHALPGSDGRERAVQEIGTDSAVVQESKATAGMRRPRKGSGARLPFDDFGPWYTSVA